MNGVFRNGSGLWLPVSLKNRLYPAKGRVVALARLLGKAALVKIAKVFGAAA